METQTQIIDDKETPKPSWVQMDHKVGRSSLKPLWIEVKIHDQAETILGWAPPFLMMEFGDKIWGSTSPLHVLRAGGRARTTSAGFDKALSKETGHALIVQFLTSTGHSITYALETGDAFETLVIAQKAFHAPRPAEPKKDDNLSSKLTHEISNRVFNPVQNVFLAKLFMQNDGIHILEETGAEITKILHDVIKDTGRPWQEQLKDPNLPFNEILIELLSRVQPAPEDAVMTALNIDISAALAIPDPVAPAAVVQPAPAPQAEKPKGWKPPRFRRNS